MIGKRPRSRKQSEEVPKPSTKKTKKNDEEEEITTAKRPRSRRQSEDIQKPNAKKQKLDEDEDDFTSFGIDKRIKEKLKEQTILSLFEVQKAVYKPTYEGKNVIVASLTGSGKTLSFVLPIIQKAIDADKLKNKHPFCMVITPTRELCIQVSRVFSDLAGDSLNFKTVQIYGGVSIDDQSI
jgi:superfamily II DNA/RNA helicase